MLKIYRAFDFKGELVLEDKVVFNDVRFDEKTQIRTVNPVLTEANYDNTSLEKFNFIFKNSLNSMDEFGLYKPMTYKTLEEYIKTNHIPSDFDSYESNGLNEEAILLFTNNVWLVIDDETKVDKIFSDEGPGYVLGDRPIYQEGIYIVKPNALFEMGLAPNEKGKCGSIDKLESYEVLQSQNLGKRLILSKMNRHLPRY